MYYSMGSYRTYEGKEGGNRKRGHCTMKKEDVTQKCVLNELVKNKTCLKGIDQIWTQSVT